MPPTKHIARGLLAAILLACFSVTGVAQTQASASGDLVVSDVTVISPERASPLEHAHVRIRDGRIAEVSAKPLDAKTQVDGRGRFLIPGLIDTHTHLGWVPGMSEAQLAAHPDLQKVESAQEPRSYLYFGYTTVLSLLGTAEPIKRWNALDVRPDAYFCGGTPVYGGYQYQGVPSSPYFIFNPDQAPRIPVSVNKADHAPEAVVKRMAQDGAVCVKSAYESGFGPDTGKLPVPSLSAIQAIVAAAHARNMPVFLHANSKPAQEFAVNAGVDVIAHGMWNGHELKGGALEPEVQALVGRIVARRMGYQPTAQVIRGLAALADPKFLTDPMLTHSYPAPLLAWYRTDEAGWFRRELGDSSAFLLRRGNPSGNAVITALARSNARLLFGTDTPSAPTYANPPGLNGLYEMRNWIAAGVSLKQLFNAATLENARVIRLDREVGSVEAGKKANLLLLRANPLESVEAYNAIETVFLAGRPIKRETLSARNAPAR